MPAFEHGSLAIVACPDADVGGEPMAAHHHHPGDHHATHQLCPYASASGLNALGADWTPLLGTVFFAVALLLGRTFVFVARHSFRARPPSRAPPLPA